MLSGMTSPIDYNPHDTSFMSRNLYMGPNLGPVLEAAQGGTDLEIITAVGQMWGDVHERDFPARAEAFAEEIFVAQPLLIGLQEVSLFEAGDVYYLTGGQAAGTAETIDYLDILLDKLSDRGLSYTTVVTTNDFGGNFTALVDPTLGALQDIHYMDRDVILARTDLPDPALTLSNVQSGNFTYSVPLNLGGMEIPILRGWNSVDVQVWGQDFRFVNTHLEDDNPLYPGFGMVQMAQAAELVGPGGPTDTELPVILVGDFNSAADGSGTQSYSIVTVGAGFTDVWNQTHPGEPGYTWSENDDLRGDPVTADADPGERIDLVLYRGDLFPRAMDRVMAPVTPTDSTTGPLWPSDHAGVAATLSLQVMANGREIPWAVVNDDPQRPGEQALFIVGTDRSDNIVVNQYGNGSVSVYMRGLRTHERFRPTFNGRIYIHASAGNDIVNLSRNVSHDAMVFAGAGHDCVFGGSGNDEISGGAGCDSLFGNRGDDWLSGDDGNDILFGGLGMDRLYGGTGDDWLFGGLGDDLLDGGDGYDWLFGEAGSDILVGGERNFG